MGTGTMVRLSRRPPAGSIEDLIAGATLREPMAKDGESKSGSSFERVVIGGQPYVLKHLHVDDDWIQRATGDIECRPLLTWTSGLFDAVPGCIDHTVVGVAAGVGRNGWGAAVLMRDVGPWLVRVADGIAASQQLRFLDHMARLHAGFWGFRDTIGLMPVYGRYSFLSSLTGEHEAAIGGTDPIPRMHAPGWARIRDEAPRAHSVVVPLHTEPGPLVDALRRTPATLVHGDWKAGNLGTLPDGRTVLLDWAFHGEGPGCTDLAWYIAVNCDLLPASKEDTITAYREALRRNGIDTDGWWDAQLALAMIGGFALLGWCKSGDELAWWEDRMPEWAHYLDA